MIHVFIHFSNNSRIHAPEIGESIGTKSISTPRFSQPVSKSELFLIFIIANVYELPFHL